MAKLTKRQQAFQGKVEAGKVYPAVEALNLVRQNATAKFDESVDVAIQLGIDPRKSDQAVRGAVVMPEGTGKTVRVAVFTQGAKASFTEGAFDAGTVLRLMRLAPRVLTSLVLTIWLTRLRLVNSTLMS